MPDRERQSLADFAAMSGARVPCAANLPLDMDDPRFVWFVERGTVDVFLVERLNGQEQSAPHHMIRIEEGRLLPGVSPHSDGTTLGLTAKGLPGAVLRRLPVASLGAVRSEDIVSTIDAWIVDVAAALALDVLYRPQSDAFIETGQPPRPVKGIVSARRGVAWLTMSSPDTTLFMDLVEVAPTDPGAGPGLIPVTSASWIVSPLPQQVSAVSSETLWDTEMLLQALEHYHKVALRLQRINRSLAVLDQQNLDRAAAIDRRIEEERARSRLFNPHGLPAGEGEDGSGAALREVLRIIGKHEGIRFDWPSRSDAPDFVPALDDILDVSGTRRRRVRIAREKPVVGRRQRRNARLPGG